MCGTRNTTGDQDAFVSHRMVSQWVGRGGGGRQWDQVRLPACAHGILETWVSIKRIGRPISIQRLLTVKTVITNWLWKSLINTCSHLGRALLPRMAKIRALGTLWAKPKERGMWGVQWTWGLEVVKSHFGQTNLLWSCVMVLVPKSCNKLSCDRVSEGNDIMRGREEMKLGDIILWGCSGKAGKYLRFFIKSICCLERKIHVGLEYSFIMFQ